MTLFNDVTFDIFEVLLHHNYFEIPQIGQITQFQITKTQKIKTIQYFYKNNFFTN